MSLPHPFVDVPGVINMRSVGGLPTHYTSISNGSRAPTVFGIKPNALYRSGETSRITDHGKRSLVADLGVTKVFDMRSDAEIKTHSNPLARLQGVEFVRASVSDKESYDPVSLSVRVQAFAMHEKKAFMVLYQEILEHGGAAFDAIFRHLRDHPDQPCLIHCTAGKDRTGIAVALFLMLLGVHDDYIINDYALTTIGLAPAMPALVARFQKQAVFRDNMKGTMGMASSRPETMRDTLQMIREKFGGAEGYLRSHTSLTDADFKTLREAYLVPL